MSKEVNKYPASITGGVRPLAIRGVFEDERYRISEEYTDEDRKWRKQWFKDQVLAPDEPRHVPELEKELKNPIRRFASAPFQYMENKMTPVFGSTFSSHFRYTLPKALFGIGVIYFTYYQLKYNKVDWTRAKGWSVLRARPVVVPGDPGFPFKRTKINPQDYEDKGFQARTVFRD